MPTYVFKCEKCETVWEETLKYEERDKPVEYGCTATVPCDGKISRIPVFPGMNYRQVGGKPDDAFNDKLKEIKRKHYKSDLTIYE